MALRVEMGRMDFGFFPWLVSERFSSSKACWEKISPFVWRWQFWQQKSLGLLGDQKDWKSVERWYAGVAMKTPILNC